jgi:hypothetical protein
MWRTAVVCLFVFVVSAPATFAQCDASRASLVLNEDHGGFTASAPLVTSESEVGTVAVWISPVGDSAAEGEETSRSITTTIRIEGEEESVIAVDRIPHSDGIARRLRTRVGELTIRGSLHGQAMLEVTVNACGGAE